MLPHDEIKVERKICLKEILDTPDDRDIGYFIEVDLMYSDCRKKKKLFPILF